MSAQEEIKQLEELITKKIPLSPSNWLDHIGRVVVMMSEETDLLYSLQKQVAISKSNHISTGKSVAEAKVLVEAMDLYEQMQKQKALCHKIEELIRIGKLQSKLKESEYNGGNL